MSRVLNCGRESKNYQGDIFEGNACRKMLKKADALSDNNICEHVGGTLTLAPFVSAFKAMDKIVNSCFSVRKVDNGLDEKIKELNIAFAALESVTETLKIHVSLKHLKHCIFQ